ncbi:hypothetical protein G6F43_004631 [Rhizopus delemar]|nr:hypothetical protein G6F43_004631 [Rhizopus delemar]
MVFFRKKKENGETIKYVMTPKPVENVVDENGILQITGCLPIDAINKRFLLVTSASHPDSWVIPKGSWAKDETQKQAAMRETWEEAGVKGTIKRQIGVFAEKAKEGVRAHHTIYEMEIKQVAKKFPEQKIRERRWFTYDDAMAAVKAHYVKDAISMSSLSPLVHPDEEDEKKEKKKKKKEKKKEEEEDEEDEEKKEKKKKKKEKKKEEEEEEEDEEKKEKKKKKKEEEEEDDEKKEKKKKKKDKKDEDEEGDEKKKRDDVLGEEVVVVEEGEKKKKKNKNKEAKVTELTDEEIVKIQLSKFDLNDKHEVPEFESKK